MPDGFVPENQIEYLLKMLEQLGEPISSKTNEYLNKDINMSDLDTIQVQLVIDKLNLAEHYVNKAAQIDNLLKENTRQDKALQESTIENLKDRALAHIREVYNITNTTVAKNGKRAKLLKSTITDKKESLKLEGNTGKNSFMPPIVNRQPKQRY